ncbi:MAG: D-aminoacylase [Deltaproteobacteria bacterium]|nr:D-aminoacylase [Deltaproteobacteria bacterium]
MNYLIQIKNKKIEIKDGKISSITLRNDKVATTAIPQVASQPHNDAEQNDKGIINASNLLISAGFIDCHAHSDYFIFLNPGADSKVYQGVTTDIGGNCGYSAAPVWGPCFEKRNSDYQTYENLPIPWHSLTEYAQAMDQMKISMNYGHLVGHNTLRESETGVVNRVLTATEIQNMCSKLEEAFQEGATGLSTGLVYPPACYSNEKELLELAKVCKKYDRIFAFHMRNENDFVVEATEETLNVGRKSGCKIQISHLKTSGKRNWHKMPKICDLIEKALTDGIDVAADRYPYTASQTGLLQVLPEWAFDGGEEAIIKRLKDKTARADIATELNKKYEKDYYNNVQIMEVASEKNKQYEGLRVAEAAKKRDQDSFEFVCDLLIEEKTKVSAIYFTMSEENLEMILQKEYVMIGSDSGCRSCVGRLSKGALHPRAFGTFPRVISEYVKKKKIITLDQALYKMSTQPAQRFGLKNRGKIEEGYWADLVLFDLDKIEDTSTFKEPLHYPTGIEYVFVNGELVIKGGKHTGKRPGHFLKY